MRNQNYHPMKRLFLLLITSLTLSCCEKDKPSKPVIEVDKLPPATQTGANTIGCLLDGKVFKPGYYNNSTNCFYQYVDTGYFFVVPFNNRDSKSNLTTLAVGTQKLQLHEGDTYDLFE